MRKHPEILSIAWKKLCEEKAEREDSMSQRKNQLELYEGLLTHAIALSEDTEKQNLFYQNYH